MPNRCWVFEKLLNPIYLKSIINGGNNSSVDVGLSKQTNGTLVRNLIG